MQFFVQNTHAVAQFGALYYNDRVNRFLFCTVRVAKRSYEGSSGVLPKLELTRLYL